MHSSALAAMAVTVVVNLAMNFKSHLSAFTLPCDHCYSPVGHRLFGGVAELLGWIQNAFSEMRHLAQVARHSNSFW